MPLFIALALYGGAFIGYCLGDRKVADQIAAETSVDMQDMRDQMDQEIKQEMAK